MLKARKSYQPLHVENTKIDIYYFIDEDGETFSFLIQTATRVNFFFG